MSFLEKNYNKSVFAYSNPVKYVNLENPNSRINIENIGTIQGITEAKPIYKGVYGQTKYGESYYQ